MSPDSDSGLRLGIAHHLGWAVVVTASARHEVVDRRRIELVDSDLPAAPIHHEGGPHELHRSGAPVGDDALAALVDKVRASVSKASDLALDALSTALSEPIISMSLRAWPLDFPQDVETQRRSPYESQADSIMYRQELADAGRGRGWQIEYYDAKSVESMAGDILGNRATEVLHGPRKKLGPPWNADHRTALAATIISGRSRPQPS